MQSVADRHTTDGQIDRSRVVYPVSVVIFDGCRVGAAWGMHGMYVASSFSVGALPTRLYVSVGLLVRVGCEGER